MKCRKCGYEISENDNFCQNCGCKVDKTEIVSESTKNNESNITGLDNESSTEKSIKPISTPNGEKGTNKKKRRTIIGVIIGIIVIAITIITLIVWPKEVEIEADKLASLIYEGNEAQYYLDTLYVHGYLVRDTKNTSNDSGYYILVSDIENWQNISDLDEMLIFTFEKGLDANLGTGSEIIVKGKLRGQNEDYATDLLIGESIEIKSIVEPVINIDFNELNNSWTKYIDKRVKISGRMIDVLGIGHYLTDDEIDNSICIKGFTENEFRSYYKRGSKGIVTGVLKYDKDEVYIQVEGIEQNDFTQELSYEYGVSVSDCYYYHFGNGIEITIHGKYIRNATYSAPYAIQDENSYQFIVLDTSYFGGVDLDDYFESGQSCVITGYIYETGTGYRIDVQAIG